MHTDLTNLVALIVPLKSVRGHESLFTVQCPCPRSRGEIKRRARGRDREKRRETVRGTERDGEADGREEEKDREQEEERDRQRDRGRDSWGQRVRERQKGSHTWR